MAEKMGVILTGMILQVVMWFLGIFAVFSSWNLGSTKILDRTRSWSSDGRCFRWFHPFLIAAWKIAQLKFNSSPLKISHPKRKVIFQPSFFRGYVKLRGCNSWFTYSHYPWKVVGKWSIHQTLRELWNPAVNLQGCTRVFMEVIVIS